MTNVSFTDITVEFEYSTGVWTDVSDDIVSPITVRCGIKGNGPLDRVASTGTMTFTLENKDNAYTPNHIDCASGFAKGLPCRITVTYDSTENTKFYGRVDRIRISKGSGILYYTEVTVVDYMNVLATHELQLPEFAEDERMDQVVMAIIDNMTIKPLSVEAYTSQDTFATVFDTTRPTQLALSEISKAAQSELGYVYVRNEAYNDADYVTTLYVSGSGVTPVNGTYYYYRQYNGKPIYRNEFTPVILAWISADNEWQFWDFGTTIYYSSTDDVASPDLVTTWAVDTYGKAPVPTVVDANSITGDEILVSVGRYYRPKMTSKATFTDEDISGIELNYGEHYYNEVKTIVYPREVDSAATSVLFTLNRYIAIQPGATATVKGRFIDPNQEAVNVTGTDMVTPVATTDYLFNTASDGGGSDITADLGVVATYGANGVEYALTNNNAGLGYVTFLQARGKGIYTYNPVEYSQEYDTGIDADGRRTLTLQMPYQDNPLVGESFADTLLDLYKTKRLEVSGITYEAGKSATLIEYFRDLYVGDRITLNLSDLGIEGDYFIQGADFVVGLGNSVRCTYRLITEGLMPSADYWELDSATLSQLGETTKLGF